MKNFRSYIIIFFILFFSLSMLNSCHGIEIPPAEMESFSEVRTIKVNEEQSYYDDKGNRIEDFSLPVYEDCEKILENIGFSVMGENGKEYDSILKIEMSGTTLCDYYHDMETNTKALLYTGAQIDGNISIRADNEDSVERDFFEVREPPTGTVFKPTIPSNAPFDRLGWQKHLFLLLSDIWGMEILSKSLDIEGIGTLSIRKQVIKALEESEEPSSVDILIGILEDEEYEYYSTDVIAALGRKGEESAVPVIIEALSRGNSSLDRKAAAEALGEIGSINALDALKQALEEDEDEVVKEACREAIDIILGSGE